MQKLLTIAIPAYNAEKYIKKCLGSLAVESTMDRIEVIIINDGSTDNTAKIAQQWVDRWPNTFKLINKSNGGHGSAINIAVDIAMGRFFKVIDADDWIISKNLEVLLRILEVTDAHAVITGFHMVHMQTGNRTAYSAECSLSGKTISMTDMMTIYKRISLCCSFHGLIYRMDTYRNSKFILTEGIYYEDQEYATLPFSKVEKVLIVPIFFYQYLIGNNEQSVADLNQVKNNSNLKLVTRKILEYRREASPFNEYTDEYFLRRVSDIAMGYLKVATIKMPDRKKGRECAVRFYKYIIEEEPKLGKYLSMKYTMLRIINYLHCSPLLFKKLQESIMYNRIRRLWAR